MAITFLMAVVDPWAYGPLFIGTVVAFYIKILLEVKGT